MKKTTDALEIINNLIGKDNQMQQMITEAYLNAQVGQLIYDTRVRAGLTQKQLADLIDVDESTIDDLEEGDYEGNIWLWVIGHGSLVMERIRTIPDRQ